MGGHQERQVADAGGHRIDVLLTADKGIEHQQNLAALPIAVLIVLARSNRMEDMAPAVPAILTALSELPPRSIRKVTA